MTASHETSAFHRPGTSVFAGADVCAAAGFRLRPHGHAAAFDDDVWRFDDVDGISVQMSRSGQTGWTSLPSATHAGGWPPRSTCSPGSRPAILRSRSCRALSGSP
jgi:hypothetical protein